MVYVTAPVMSVCRKYLQKSGWYREISDLVPLWGGVFFCEQRARQPCLHGYLATATKIRCSAVCSGVSDCFSHLPSNKQEKEKSQEASLLSSIKYISYCSDNSFANSADRISICIFSSATMFSSGACEKGTEN